MSVVVIDSGGIFESTRTTVFIDNLAVVLLSLVDYLFYNVSKQLPFRTSMEWNQGTKSVSLAEIE
tara:strand:- start:245025 stop:245219 length:195 start_codon:yes stop_codon:yes gene_type:complete